jgi:fructose-1,6-bisphosphatase/inositol monophosphatase family enzyme
MALVAAGLADATWTLYLKNEWDVAAGGTVLNAPGSEPVFNRPDPSLHNFLARPPRLLEELRAGWLARSTISSTIPLSIHRAAGVTL